MFHTAAVASVRTSQRCSAAISALSMGNRSGSRREGDNHPTAHARAASWAASGCRNLRLVQRARPRHLDQSFAIQMLRQILAAAAEVGKAVGEPSPSQDHASRGLAATLDTFQNQRGVRLTARLEQPCTMAVSDMRPMPLVSAVCSAPG